MKYFVNIFLILSVFSVSLKVFHVDITNLGLPLEEKEVASFGESLEEKSKMIIKYQTQFNVLESKVNHHSFPIITVTKPILIIGYFFRPPLLLTA